MDVSHNYRILLLHGFQSQLYLVLHLALTFLSSALPIACSSSFVLLGSWPAMIFVGRTVRLVPVTTSTRDNSKQSLIGGLNESQSLTGTQKAKVSLTRRPRASRNLWGKLFDWNHLLQLQFCSTSVDSLLISWPTYYTSALHVFVISSFTAHSLQRWVHKLQHQYTLTLHIVKVTGHQVSNFNQRWRSPVSLAPISILPLLKLLYFLHFIKKSTQSVYMRI